MQHLFLLMGVGWGTASRCELLGIAATAAAGFTTLGLSTWGRGREG